MGEDEHGRGANARARIWGMTSTDVGANARARMWGMTSTDVEHTSPLPSSSPPPALGSGVRVHDANTAFEAIVEVAFPAAASEHLRLDDNVLACARIVPPSAQRCSVSMRASVGRGGGRRART